MIVEKTNETEAVYLGDVKENKVDIDRENIDFIASILTTNLYANPLESFLRETISNGEDSQKEAKIDDPLLLIINRDGDLHFRLTIRDFGTGISEEKFDKIYRKIGTSTKRDSNEYIGHFGIGKFASLAVADVVNIVSYYNNVRYDYLMYKNGEGINIDKISITAGQYRNGLEVSVRLDIRNYAYQLRSVLHKFVFFEKLYISDDSHIVFSEDTVNKFNHRKIHHTDCFSSCDFNATFKDYILYNKVLYPLTISRGDIVTTNQVFLRFDIGELDVTPNRESLRFSNKTETSIKSKISQFNSYIENKLTEKDSLNFESLRDWTNYWRNGDINININEFTNLTVLVKDVVSFFPSLKLKITYKDKEVSSTISPIVNLLGSARISEFVKYHKSYDIFYSKDHWVHFRDFLEESYPFLITSDNSYSAITKKYINSKYKRNSSLYILDENKFIAFKHYILKYFIAAYKTECPSKSTLDSFMFVYKDLKKSIESIPIFNNKDVPQSFKDDLKKQKASQQGYTVAPSTTTESRKVAIQILGKPGAIKWRANYAYEHSSVVETIDLEELIKNNKKKLIVYGDKTDTIIKTLEYIFREKGLKDKYIFVQLVESKFKYLKPYKNTIEVYDFINSNSKTIRELATVYNVFKNKESLPKMVQSILMYSYRIIDLIHPKYISALIKLRTIQEKNRYYGWMHDKDVVDILEAYISKGWVDVKLEDVKDFKFSNLIDSLSEYNWNGCKLVQSRAFVFCIVKSKLVLPKPEAYKYLKDNPII